MTLTQQVPTLLPISLLVLTTIASAGCGTGSNHASNSDDAKNNDLYVVAIDGEYGFIDSEGTMAIPPQFAYAFPFREGMACVEVDQPGSHRRYGFIDTTGEIIVPAIYDNAGSFSEGLACVGMGDADGKNIEHWGFIDRTGVIAIPLEHRSVGDFHEGLAAFQMPFDRSNLEYDMGYIDNKGTVVIPAKFSTWTDIGFKEGMASVRKRPGSEELWGAIDKSGMLVIDYRFRSPFEFEDGLALVWDGENCGWIDRTGEMTIGPFTDFEDANSFSEGLAAFRRNGKWGFLNKAGETAIIPQYDYANSFHEGLAAVRVDDRYGFIDTEGQMAIEPTFEGMHISNTGFSGGMCRMSDNKKDVWINPTGTVVYSFAE